MTTLEIIEEASKAMMKKDFRTLIRIVDRIDGLMMFDSEKDQLRTIVERMIDAAEQIEIEIED
jgi:hypothetical protein